MIGVVSVSVEPEALAVTTSDGVVLCDSVSCATGGASAGGEATVYSTWSCDAPGALPSNAQAVRWPVPEMMIASGLPFAVLCDSGAVAVIAQIRCAVPLEQSALGELHRRSSWVWEEDRAALQAHPDALGVSLAELFSVWTAKPRR